MLKLIPPCQPPDSAQEHPLVIILPWMGAAPQNVAKYVQLAQYLGCDVAVWQPEHLALWVPQLAQQAARRLAQSLELHLSQHGPRPLVFGVFSGSAKALYVELLSLLCVGGDGDAAPDASAASHQVPSQQAPLQEPQALPANTDSATTHPFPTQQSEQPLSKAQHHRHHHRHKWARRPRHHTHPSQHTVSRPPHTPATPHVPTQPQQPPAPPTPAPLSTSCQSPTPASQRAAAHIPPEFWQLFREWVLDSEAARQGPPAMHWCEGAVAQSRGPGAQPHRSHYPLLHQCCCGQWFDSSPVDFTSESGCRMLAPPGSGNPLWRGLVMAGGGAFDFFAWEVWERQRVRFWTFLAFSPPMLHLPTLFLYSRDDPMCDANRISGLARLLRYQGATQVDDHPWDTSEHCAHLRKHPQSYQLALAGLLARAKDTSSGPQDNDSTDPQQPRSRL